MNTPSTAGSISEEWRERPVKRMRMGTRSCAECRRRKVRCIFPTAGAICKECLVHDSHCVPQKSSRASRPKTEQDVQQRLEKLENLVRHLRSSVHVDAESSNVS